MNVPDDVVRKWARQLGLVRENTRRVEGLIRERLVVPPETDLSIPGAVLRPCPTCGGSVELNVPETVIASRPNLELVWNPCGDCESRDKLLRGGVPLNLVHATLENWKISDEADRSEFEKVDKFTKKWVGFLAIESGTFGNGKSHLAAGVCRRAMESKRTFRFITQAELLRAVRDRYNDSRSENVVANLKKVGLLVLDEVGVSVGGRDELPTLHEILAHRYGARLPTVFTTNISREAFRDAIGQRIADRLREATFAWAEIHAVSFRAGNRRTYLHGELPMK